MQICDRPVIQDRVCVTVPSTGGYRKERCFGPTPFLHSAFASLETLYYHFDPYSRTKLIRTVLWSASLSGIVPIPIIR